MQVSQSIWAPTSGWSWAAEAMPRAPDFVLAFGSRHALADPAVHAELRARYDALLSCSSAGEITGTRVLDDGVVATAVWLEQSRARGVSVALASAAQSADAGRQLAAGLAADDLAHVLVFSEGLRVNGSALVRGLASALPAHVRVSGGLAADGDRFGTTLVGWNEAPTEGRVAAIGLYGDRLEVACGSVGGWDAFGPDRVVTRAEQNVLYELDGEPALALYKKYLGEHAQGLPASALLFPLSLTPRPRAPSVVRTVLGLREAERAMVFAGELPVGARVRLMKANVDRLVEGASQAASACRTVQPERGARSLALLVSCVGRRLVMRQRVEEELDAVRENLGTAVSIAGLYSYGEIAPSAPDLPYELHNQTMTVTLLSERESSPP